MKCDLNLNGSAEEIFIRSAKIIENMIDTILNEKPKPIKQKGDIVNFERRKPEHGDISKLITIEDIYDYIRMLDCEGYPKSFLEMGEFKLEFYKSVT